MAYVYRKRAVWYVAFRTSNGWQRKSLRTRNEKEAKRLLKTYEGRESTGRPLQSSISLQDFADYYLDYRRQCLKPETYATHGEHTIRPFIRFLVSAGLTSLDEVTERDVRAYLVHRLQTCSPATVRTHTVLIKLMFRSATDWGFVEEDPTTGIKPPRAPDTRKSRALSEEEVETVLRAAAATALEGPVATGIFAGLRKAELTNLEWSDIDWDTGFINVRNKKGARAFTTKNKKSRRIPLHPRLRTILARLEAESGYCFLSPEGKQWNGRNLLRDFCRLVERSGINPSQVNLHALRHTFLTLLASKTRNLPAVQRMAGHASVQTTMRYVHVDDETLRAEMAKWE